MSGPTRRHVGRDYGVLLVGADWHSMVFFVVSAEFIVLLYCF